MPRRRRGSSVERDRVAGGAGAADDLERRPHERELVDLVFEQLRELEILDVPYPAPCLHLGVTRHREFLALLAGGLRVVGRRVAAGQDDLALGHVLARAEPEARLAGVELVASLRLLRRRQPLPLRIEPEITVAGVEEHAVAL